MKRKIIRQGKSALTITIPTKWAKVNNLNPGKEVNVSISGDNLVIEPQSGKDSKKIEIKLYSTNHWYVSQVIRNTYFSEFDEVVIHFEDKKTFKLIQENIDILLGYEILSKTKNSCIIKNMSNSIESQFPDLLRRIFLLTLDIMKEISTELKEKDQVDFKSLRTECLRIKKFCLFARKMVTQNIMFSKEKSRANYFLLRNLAMIINNLTSIIDYLSSEKIHKVSNFSTQYFDDTIAHYRLLYENVFNKKIENLPKLNVGRDELIVIKLFATLKKAPSNESMVLHYLGEIVRIISSSGGFVFTIITSSLSKNKENIF